MKLYNLVKRINGQVVAREPVVVKTDGFYLKLNNRFISEQTNYEARIKFQGTIISEKLEEVRLTNY